MPRTSSNVFFGSGVVLSIATLSGDFIVDPVCITDGLSSATIEAIMTDLKRSAQLKVALCGNVLK